jgi:hypothetical protein
MRKRDPAFEWRDGGLFAPKGSGDTWPLWACFALHQSGMAPIGSGTAKGLKGPVSEDTPTRETRTARKGPMSAISPHRPKHVPGAVGLEAWGLLRSTRPLARAFPEAGGGRGWGQATQRETDRRRGDGSTRFRLATRPVGRSAAREGICGAGPRSSGTSVPTSACSAPPSFPWANGTTRCATSDAL